MKELISHNLQRWRMLLGVKLTRLLLKTVSMSHNLQRWRMLLGAVRYKSNQKRLVWSQPPALENSLGRNIQINQLKSKLTSQPPALENALGSNERRPFIDRAVEVTTSSAGECSWELVNYDPYCGDAYGHNLQRWRMLLGEATNPHT